MESLQFCTFICQVTSARRQRSDLFGLRVKLKRVGLPEIKSTDTTNSFVAVS